MFWNIADFLERKGYYTGLLVIIAPIIYDLIGIMHKKDLHIKIQDCGVIMQVIGVVIILLARIARRWGRK